MNFSVSIGYHWPLRSVAAALLRGGFVLSLFWSALYASWVGLSAIDFAYPVFYRWLDIEQHIDRYGPYNIYGRKDFVGTGEAERRRIVGAMVAAINDGGRGLAEIAYTDSRGRSVPFLTAAERIHLQSVARLIDRFRLSGYVAVSAFAIGLALMWWRRQRPPPVRRILLGALAGVALAAMLVLALGPERVFNTLHEWVFPAGEQWFFYYEESLMTTLLKAPDLFGAMAVLWVLAWLLLAAAAYAAVSRLLARS